MSGEPLELDELFHRARAMARGAERESFLDRELAADPALRRRLDILLRADEEVGDRFLSAPEPPTGDSRPRESVDGTRCIGPYQLLEVLGHGAQATVYRARHSELRRTVALKVLHRPLALTESGRQRFRREAEVTASLDHPGLCSVFETGETDGTAWIAMQWVPGRTLAAVLQDSAPEPPVLPEPVVEERGGSTGVGPAGRARAMRAVLLVERAARALHVAHERGLVHRDIKPANLMVTEAGAPVVLDFGVAREGAADSAVPGLTRTADVLGTPHYIAPEQLRAADPVDRRADVYALGVTLYECLTGRRPFDAPAREALYRLVLTSEPTPLRRLDSSLPRDLEVVVATALEKEPGRRYSTALALADDLARVRHLVPIQARPVTQLGRLLRWARRAPWIAGSLAVAVLSLLAGLIASLALLGTANSALDTARKVEAAWYDSISWELSAQDLRGETTWLQARLRERALALLEQDVPGFGARISAFAPELHRVHGDPAANRPLRHGRALLEVWDSLDHAAGVCAADWLHLQARGILSEHGWGRGPAGPPDDLVAFAERSAEAVQSLPVEDPRRLRAQVLLLDALCTATTLPQRVERAVVLAERYRAAEGAPGVRRDAARRALYESRLAGALLLAGDSERALALLAEAEPRVTATYPETFLAFGAQAWHVRALHDVGAAREAKAIQDRLCDGIAAQTNFAHTQLSHWFTDHVEVAVGTGRPALLAWMRGFAHRFWCERVIASECDTAFDAFEAACLRDGVDPDDPVHGLLSVFFTAAAALQMDFGNPNSDLVTRLLDEAIECGSGSDAARHSEAYVSALVFRGDRHIDVGAFDAAHRIVSELRRLDVCAPGAPLGSYVHGLEGRLLAETGGYEQAEELLAKAFAHDLRWFGPVHNWGYTAARRLVRLYRAWGRFDDAVALHRQMLAGGDWHQFRTDLAVTLLAFGRTADAERELATALTQRPDFPQARRLRCLAALESGDAQRAEALAREDLVRGLEASRPVLACALRAQGRGAEALAEFERAARSVPGLRDTGGFWRDHGLQLAELGRTDAARALLVDLTTREPGEPWCWAVRAEVLATMPGATEADRRQAVDCAVRADDQCGGRRAALVATRARAEKSAGMQAEAEASAARMLELMAGRDAAWLSRAVAEELARVVRAR